MGYTEAMCGYRGYIRYFRRFLWKYGLCVAIRRLCGGYVGYIGYFRRFVGKYGLCVGIGRLCVGIGGI